MHRRAKIIATIGPASRSEEVIRHLIEAGMDVARLNFSHGNHQAHGAAVASIRRVSEEVGRPVGILQDLQGPRLRTGHLDGDRPVELRVGASFRLTAAPIVGNADAVQVQNPELPRLVGPGDSILLDGGSIELQVISIEEDTVQTEVTSGGELKARAGVNVPGVDLGVPSLTQKDREDLEFGMKNGIDVVALSFVRGSSELVKLRELLDEMGSSVPIVAKLERPEAVDELEAILVASEGVMVARGDLGIEVSAERVPSIQKRIIQRANEENKLVITATEMLDSMIRNPRPTRAEASDVANAVFDGTDALMLSGETAIGHYPVRAVEIMDRIVQDAEAHAHEWGEPLRPSRPELRDDAVATTRAARKLAEDREVAAVAVFTRTGRTAQLMSKARPSSRIVAFTPEPDTYSRLTMLWGVEPRLCPMVRSVEEMVEIVDDDLRPSLAGEPVVVVASLPVGEKGPPNFAYLRTVGE